MPTQNSSSSHRPSHRRRAGRLSRVGPGFALSVFGLSALAGCPVASAPCATNATVVDINVDIMNQIEGQISRQLMEQLEQGQHSLIEVDADCSAASPEEVRGAHIDAEEYSSANATPVPGGVVEMPISEETGEGKVYFVMPDSVPSADTPDSELVTQGCVLSFLGADGEQLAPSIEVKAIKPAGQIRNGLGR